MGCSKHQTCKQSAGFTLIEVSITVAILALATGVIVASTGTNLAELRATAGRVSGLVRQVYAESALLGQTHRLVFDFEANAVSIEATDQALRFDEDSSALEEAVELEKEEEDSDEQGTEDFGLPIGDSMFSELVGQLQEQQSLQDSEGGEGESFAAMGAFLGMGALGASAAGADGFGEARAGIKLSRGMKLLDVWVQGMSEPKSSGKAYLYFFPHGYTQDAIVHLEAEGGRVFSVKISALTGKTLIQGEYMEIPK